MVIGDDEDLFHPCRPVHSRKFAQFSPEWYQACSDAFTAAMSREMYRAKYARVRTNIPKLIPAYYTPKEAS